MPGTNAMPSKSASFVFTGTGVPIDAPRIFPLAGSSVMLIGKIARTLSDTVNQSFPPAHVSPLKSVAPRYSNENVC